MKPYLNDLQYKDRLLINRFEGINTALTPFTISDTQAASMKNVTTRSYPVLSPRPMRNTIDETLSGDIRHLGTVEGEKIAVVEGNKWRYYENGTWTDLVTVSGTEDGDSVVFRGKTVYVNGSNAYVKDGNTATVNNNIPKSHFIVTHYERLIAANKDESKFYYSGYGDFAIGEEWASGQTEAGEWPVTTPNGENISAVAAYNNKVIFFKHHSIHELYGATPYEYQVIPLTGDIGCMSHRSIAEINGSLYFVSDGAVREYSGGTLPSDISLPVKYYMENAGDLTKATAGTDGKRYYLSLPQKGNDNILLVYDTETKFWTVEDSISIVQFVRLKGLLYGIDSDKRLITMTGGADESFEWSWGSKLINSTLPSLKDNWHRMYLLAEFRGQSKLTVTVQSNQGIVLDNTYSEDITYSGIKVIDIPLPTDKVYNSSWFQIWVKGNGDCRVHSIELQKRTKGGSYNG